MTTQVNDYNSYPWLDAEAYTSSGWHIYTPLAEILARFTSDILTNQAFTHILHHLTLITVECAGMDASISGHYQMASGYVVQLLQQQPPELAFLDNVSIYGLHVRHPGKQISGKIFLSLSFHHLFVELQSKYFSSPEDFAVCLLGIQAKWLHELAHYLVHLVRT